MLSDQVYKANLGSWDQLSSLFCLSFNYALPLVFPHRIFAMFVWELWIAHPSVEIQECIQWLKTHDCFIFKLKYGSIPCLRNSGIWIMMVQQSRYCMLLKKETRVKPPGRGSVALTIEWILHTTEQLFIICVYGVVGDYYVMDSTSTILK